MVQDVIPEIRCEEYTDIYGRFVAEPLERGFGTTLGNALRRVLLSSLQGAAVTWVKIDGVMHEFSTLPGVKEDVIEFLLNVKKLRLRSITDRPGRLFLEVAGPGRITAADIRPSADYEIMNPELHLLTLDGGESRIFVELNVEKGKGYLPAGPFEGLPMGAIPVDAIFTPVRKVNYSIENTRVEQRTNYDRLIIEVWTDGTITPGEAVSQSAQILINQFSYFKESRQAAGMVGDKLSLPGPGLTARQYDTPVEELRLSVRAYNALKRSNITKVGEILSMNREDLFHIRNFGDKSLSELVERLGEKGFVVPESWGVERPTSSEEASPASDVGADAVEGETPVREGS